MGHALVSLAFHAAEDRFVIADRRLTSAPMFFVGFVDFFMTGCPYLVMASRTSVLVARRSRAGLKERAAMLLRLLRARGLWSPRAKTASPEVEPAADIL
ncbi:unnamed protein product [Phytomonas sp. Hart1]|nr:unnamed protein product [Phytomonas sp. Hart1]|eukprot:CCW68951.1 unnamed protein product [Phytomonas sp. isolate Hart1]